MIIEEANPEQADLSRRSFLVLTVLGIGSAAAMSLGATTAAAGVTAAPAGEIASSGKEPKKDAEGKKAEVAQRVDPNDPLQAYNQPYYRHRRRVVRRTYRRGRRYVRRTYRRVRRRVYY